MAWIQSVMEWTRTVLEQTGYGPVALPLSFVLGLVSAIASACCTLPLLGVVVGYSGMREQDAGRTKLLAPLCFMLGTSIALVILGSVAGFIGQVVQAALGRYWKVFAGLLAISAGLAALKLLPFKLPARTIQGKAHPQGFLGTAVFGLVAGGAICVASLACNPGIYIVLGVAVLQGQAWWGMAIMAAYGLGFSLPLAILMLGVAWGKTAIKAQKTEAALRVASGICLIGAGFYFLATL